MMDRIDDMPMPLLLIEITKAAGCERPGSKGDDGSTVTANVTYSNIEQLIPAMVSSTSATTIAP